MRRCALGILLTGLVSQAGEAQVLAEWVENDPANDPNRIALGYPVPIPVNTPLPFDGFRTYAGLHMRHQDLAATTPWVNPEVIGTTRQGRTIWAYRLGDSDFETIFGTPEPATLTNGGIHAREWQSPEVVTGILELLATHEEDHHFYDFLRDNVNMVVIPSLNIDGFLQTQRYPTQNYLGSDLNSPATSPRDGRMRRKNMLGVDENLQTTNDHLFGVDLNRNNSPFWSTSAAQGNSSADNRSIVHHGAFAMSEPEAQALDAAAQLGPPEQLRVYTDVHSFSQVLLWSRNSNQRLANITPQVLNFFNQHHRNFPAGKIYPFHGPASVGGFAGIGATDEHFYYTYDIPSFTLEVEPSQPQAFGLFHPELPGWGADYGGVVENGHDGFILPESQIRRLRENMAETFAGMFYRQVGAPAVQAVRITDAENQAVVFEAEWDRVDDFNRSLFSRQLRPIEMGRDYHMRIAYDKPMRWRENGEVVPFQGISSGFLGQFTSFELNGQEIEAGFGPTTWLNQPGDYLNYEDDAFSVPFNIPFDGINDAQISGPTDVQLRHLSWDMVGTVTDANPATAVYFGQGHWNNLENTDGAQADLGGWDSTLSLQVSDQAQLPGPFLIEPGTAAAWGDVNRVGEGFIIEIISEDQAVMFWFTNDDDGGQDWYIAVGTIKGNRMEFPEVLRVSGGVFGENFDPNLVTETVVGKAKFTWESCDSAFMDWHIGNRRGRQFLSRLTSILGLDCGLPKPVPPIREEAVFSGAWGDPTHDGEGFTVEMLNDGTALVFWFSFGPDGQRRWYFGIGEVTEDGRLVFNDMLTTVGGVFGADFDPADVDEVHWGTLELDLACDGGTASYTSVEEGFGSGQQNVFKLTNFPGLECSL